MFWDWKAKPLSWRPSKIYKTIGPCNVCFYLSEIYYLSCCLVRERMCFFYCFSNLTCSHNNISKNDQSPWVYEMHNLGYNYRITDFQAALGISQLKKLRPR